VAMPPTDASFQTARVLRWQRGSTATRHADAVAAEEPLEIRVDSRPVVVTRRTPGQDAELAAGFLVTEGLICRRRDVVKISPCTRNHTRNVVDVFLGSGVSVDFAQLTRGYFLSSSCGLCGKASIAAVHRHLAKASGATYDEVWG
jgi:FdhD protein